MRADNDRVAELCSREQLHHCSPAQGRHAQHELAVMHHPEGQAGVFLLHLLVDLFMMVDHRLAAVIIDHDLVGTLDLDMLPNADAAEGVIHHIQGDISLGQKTRDKGQTTKRERQQSMKLIPKYGTETTVCHHSIRFLEN